MPRLPIDYSKTIIYKLVCRDLSVKELYVGATTNWVNRKNKHKNNCNNENYKVYQYIRANGNWDNWNMIMVEKYPCETEHESAMRERYWTETLCATLNSNMQGRTDKEYRETHKEKAAVYQAEYQITHKEQIAKQTAGYRETHKEEISTRAAKYRETHKEEAAAYQAEYQITHKEQIAKQTAKYRVDHKEQIAEYHVEYQAIHKEEISDYKADYYQKNKEQIAEKGKNKYTCKCGLIICNSSKSNHNKSIKHIKFMSTL